MSTHNHNKENMPEDVENLDNAEKIFLILLEADGGKAVPGNLWLQKELFLIAKYLEPLENYLEYEPHIQGPYSETVKNKLENLQYRGYVAKSGGEIRLTENGGELVDFIYRSASDDLIDMIEDVKSFANDLSKDELLVYIYFSFPEMTIESYEIDEVEEKRGELAEKLYRNNKVSLEKASELAGKSISKFKSEISV